MEENTFKTDLMDWLSTSKNSFEVDSSKIAGLKELYKIAYNKGKQSVGFVDKLDDFIDSIKEYREDIATIGFGNRIAYFKNHFTGKPEIFGSKILEDYDKFIIKAEEVKKMMKIILENNKN